MNFPDTCPNCGAVPKFNQPYSDRRVYSCESWIIENKYSKGPHTHKTDTCADWRTIKDAATIIREVVDDWGNAMDAPLLAKAEEWLKDNES